MTTIQSTPPRPPAYDAPRFMPPFPTFPLYPIKFHSAPAAQFRLGDAGPDEKLGVCYDPRHNAAYPRNPRQAFAEVRACVDG